MDRTTPANRERYTLAMFYASQVIGNVMRTLSERSPLGAILDSPEARPHVAALMNELYSSDRAQGFRDLPARWALGVVLGPEDPRIDDLFARITGLADPRGPLPVAVRIEPRADYEPTETERASASLSHPTTVGVFEPVELRLEGPGHGNPFVDVEVSADFTCGDRHVSVGGFYDGEGRYLIRFLPSAPGLWRFAVSSTAPSLDGHQGAIDVAPSDHRGPVRVTDDQHFEFANGEEYVPLGTTAYAWTHQSDTLMDQTVESLAAAPFTKIRMCLFPKHYLYNTDDPDHFVWRRHDDGTFDTTRFDVAYWHRLEHRLHQLEALGIQADLILFHPYDRWGFSEQAPEVDDRYLRYAVRRLAGFPNVWWSLANEYDLLLDKTPADWERIAAVVGAEDHVGHLMSIHNWLEVWDFSSPWATHCSIQRGDQLSAQVPQWRRRWDKPVVIDEMGYEGDLDQGWGNLTGEAFVERAWEVALGGGYVTHGETFWDADDEIWWSKGGILQGDSIERLAFLEALRHEAPGGLLDPLPSDWDSITGGVAGCYEITYFGDHRPRFRAIELPPDTTAEIDVIDTWHMTVKPVPGIHTGAVRVQLPARPYLAIRVRAV